MLRPRFASPLAFPFPEDAYLPVEYTPTAEITPLRRPWHPADPAELARAIHRRFEQVIDDEALLNRVSAQAFDYWEQFLRWPECGRHTAEMLDLDSL